MAVFAKHVSLSTSATAVTLSGNYQKVTITNKDSTAANFVSVAFGGTTAVSLADDTICIPIGASKTIDVQQYLTGQQTFTVTLAANAATTGAVGTNVAVPCVALTNRIAGPVAGSTVGGAGTALTFASTGVLTLTREANVGDTTLYGLLTVSNLANSDTATAPVMGGSVNQPGVHDGIVLSLIAAAGTPAVDIEASN